MKKRDVAIGIIIIVVIIVLAIVLINYLRGSIENVSDELGVELYNAPNSDIPENNCYGYGLGYGKVCYEIKYDMPSKDSKEKITVDNRCGACLECSNESVNQSVLDDFRTNYKDLNKYNDGAVIYQKTCNWKSSEGITSFTCDDDCRDGKKSDTLSRCIKVRPNSPEMECRRADCKENSECDICQKCDKVNIVDAIGIKLPVCRDLGNNGYEDDKVNLAKETDLGEKFRCSGRYNNGEIPFPKINNIYSCRYGDCVIKD